MNADFRRSSTKNQKVVRQALQCRRYAICLKNKNCEDLIVRKIYPVIPDEKAEKENHIRVIDESGEDYLYPASYFFVLELPQKVERALRRTLPVAA